MDLLNYMYGSTLSASTSSDLLNVLMVADKFEVSCCMKYCVELLLKIAISLESALSYLELPSTILVAQPLVDASKQYIVARYKDFDKFKKEAMELPLNAIELVLGYEGLQVHSEDDIYDFIKKWARAHYPEQEERRKVIANRLMQYICFRNMSCMKLNEARNCLDDFDHEQVTNLVVDALLDKLVRVPYGRHLHSSKSGFRERIYDARLVKVVYLEFSSPSCVVYFDLKKQECEYLPSSKSVLSETFVLDGRTFYLAATYSKKQHYSFCLLLVMDGGSKTCTFNWETAARMKSSKKFETYSEDTDCFFKGKDGMLWRNLFEISWNTFRSDDSDYFIDGILHLRVDLTIVGSQT